MGMTDKPKWKRAVLAGVCLLGLLAAAGGSFAAYTSQAFQRGVARNRDSETVRFTSNYLQSCANGTAAKDYAGRTVLFTEEDKKKETLNLELDIYNYVSGNASLISQKDITYDLTFTFEDGQEGSTYSVTDDTEAPETGSGKKITFSGKTLVGRSAKEHNYTITFPGNDLDRLRITVTAVPVNASVTNNQILAAVIAPCTASTTSAFQAKGEFTDKNGTPKDYAGFNYEVSITTGKAAATLTWRSDLVEIDPFFLGKIGKTKENIISRTEGTKSYKELQFEMNQAEGTGDFLIPFYIIGKDEIDKMTWNQMGSVITFQAKQDET